MMRIALAGAALTAFAAGTPACSSSPDCAGQSSVDEGVAAGQPTSRAALDAVLADPPKWLDRDGWKVGSTAAEPNQTVTFVAGSGDSVKVIRSNANKRWYLDSYKGCR